MPMPEAAVYKDRYLFLQKDKVRMAFDVVVAPPAGYAVLFEDLDEFQLRGLVVLGAYVAHDLASLFLCEDVSHWYSI